MKTEKSRQWTFEIPIEVNTLPNLTVAANEEDVIYLTYAKTSKEKISGYVRTKKRNKRSAMKKMIGKKAEFIQAKVKPPRDTLMEIQMNTQVWEYGEGGTQAKLLLEIFKLKEAIHSGAKGSDLNFRKLYNKYQPIVQRYIDVVDTRKIIKGKTTRTIRPKITKSVNGSTSCITVEPHVCVDSGDDESDEVEEEVAWSVVENLPMKVFEADRKGKQYEPTPEEAKIVDEVRLLCLTGDIASVFNDWKDKIM